MTDRERVISDIERCICHVPDACRDCSKYGGDNALRCMEDLLKDALELLKEQEPKPVELYGEDECRGIVCACPDCKAEWMGDKPDTHFCPNCGRPVKWDE